MIFDLAILLLEFYPADVLVHISTGLLRTLENWKQPKYPVAGHWLNELEHINVKRHYLACKIDIYVLIS